MEIPFFHHQQVRDLAWALFSPSLLHNLPVWVKNWQPELSSQTLSWLQQLDKQPDSLTIHLQHTNTGILGAYFESLWGFFFNHQCGRQIIKQNLQVQGSRQTLGEFDALLKDHREQFYHLEMTCKFYLQASQAVSDHPLSNWLGPQCRDRLDIKLEKTLNQQLKLARQPQARALLTSMNIPKVQPEAIFKGWLFPPLVTDITDTTDIINPAGHRGHWLHQHQLGQLPQGQYQILEKKRWLSLAWQTDMPEDLQGLSNKCREHFKHKRFALMAVSMSPSHKGWQELHRFMIVPDCWPY